MGTIIVILLIIFVISTVHWNLSGQGPAVRAANRAWGSIQDYQFHVAESVGAELDGNDSIYVWPAVDDRYALACIPQKGIVLWLEKRDGVISHTRYSAANLTAAEVVEDGRIINRASRGSQLAGALVGGAMAGVAGMIVGGLSGGSTQLPGAIYLRIQLRSVQPTMLWLECWNDKMRELHDQMLHRKRAYAAYGVLSAMMDITDPNPPPMANS